MSKNGNVIEQLTAAFPDLSPQLKQAARYVLDAPAEVAINSMRRVAVNADVAPSTMLRLAKALGYDSYEAFRQPFRESMRDRGGDSFGDRAEWLQSLAATGGGALMGGMAEATLGNVEQAFKTTPPKTFAKAAKIIRDADRAWVLGVGGAYGVAHYFTYVGGMALQNLRLPRVHASALVDNLIDVGKRDAVMAISFAPYTRETVGAVAYARERGVKVVAVTDSLASPLAQGAHAVLLAAAASPQYFPSYTAATAVVETLLAFIASAGDRALVKKLADIESFRQRMGVYLDEAEQ